jgi:capsular polysaccharide biosynthesis protein
MIRVKRALSIRRVGMTNAVEIEFTSRTPLRSAVIANAIAQSYIDGQLEFKRLARAEAVSHLKERLTELRDKAFGAVEGSQDAPVGTREPDVQARARFRERQSNVDTFRALYNNFLQRAYADPDSQVSPGARVITSAEPPLERSWPRAIIVLAIAAAAGITAGMGHSLIKTAMDHSLWTVQDVQRLTGLDCVAGVPEKSGERAERTSSACESPQAVGQGLQTVYLQRLRGLYDAMVKVAVRLKTDQSERNGVIIGVVAPTKGAGASSVAAHLARIIAESGHKTLLVDANWQGASRGEPVLNSDPDQKRPSLVAAIHPETESLDFLVLRATGPISELNASVSITGALQNQQPKYNCMVVDFHSTEQTADFEAGMAMINKLIVVVEARRTPSEGLERVLRIVPREKIAMVILNKV